MSASPSALPPRHNAAPDAPAPLQPHISCSEEMNTGPSKRKSLKTAAMQDTSASKQSSSDADDSSVHSSVPNKSTEESEKSDDESEKSDDENEESDDKSEKSGDENDENDENDESEESEESDVESEQSDDRSQESEESGESEEKETTRRGIVVPKEATGFNDRNKCASKRAGESLTTKEKFEIVCKLAQAVSGVRKDALPPPFPEDSAEAEHMLSEIIQDAELKKDSINAAFRNFEKEKKVHDSARVAEKTEKPKKPKSDKQRSWTPEEEQFLVLIMGATKGTPLADETQQRSGKPKWKKIAAHLGHMLELSLIHI